MRVITDIKKMQSWSRRIHREGKSIGFVPTMGYLHEGHLSLMRKARKENDFLVISIFINPVQFGPKEDFQRYPRDFTRDKKLSKLCGVDIIFYPEAKDMYPINYKTYVNVEDLSNVLCGASRPGHFRGVTTVVLKLFNIVRPNVSYFGQKDVQQVIIIKKMVQDLNLPVKIKILPIVREKDGLAMSSRNTYLNKEQRRDAIILYKSLQTAVGMIQSGYKDPGKIIAQMRKMIRSKRSARIDYIKIVNPQRLQKIKQIKGQILIAVAVFFGNTRLIDNAIVCA
jgi:pantoate--beta-alanine ligase